MISALTDQNIEDDEQFEKFCRTLISKAFCSLDTIGSDRGTGETSEAIYAEITINWYVPLGLHDFSVMKPPILTDRGKLLLVVVVTQFYRYA